MASNVMQTATPQGMHLTPIGEGSVLLEPGEGLDPSEPDAYTVPLLNYLQQNQAKRLLYDLINVPVIDDVYYTWLTRLNTLCEIVGVTFITINIRPPTAYALALMLDEKPPFACALDVDSAK